MIDSRKPEAKKKHRHGEVRGAGRGEADEVGVAVAEPPRPGSFDDGPSLTASDDDDRQRDDEQEGDQGAATAQLADELHAEGQRARAAGSRRTPVRAAVGHDVPTGQVSVFLTSRR